MLPFHLRKAHAPKLEHLFKDLGKGKAEEMPCTNTTSATILYIVKHFIACLLYTTTLHSEAHI